MGAIDHSDNARQHARRRARERLGLVLGRRDLQSLEARIRDGEGQLVRSCTDGRRVVRIRFLFDELVVVFDPALDCIVTVLPPGCRDDCANGDD